MRVFLDANILIRAGKPPGGPQILQLHNLSEAGLISVLTTDQTILEVARKHVNNEYSIVKVLGHNRLRSLARQRYRIELPELSDSDIREALWNEHEQTTRDMLRRLNARILQIDEVPPSAIMRDYAKAERFFTKDVKKSQFPDAFVFSRLAAEATSDRPITIVSDDADFESPCASEDNLRLFKSIPELLQQLGLDDEAPDPREFLAVRAEQIRQAVHTELLDYSLYANDVEDAYIEVVDTRHVELSDLVTFGTVAQNRTILVIGRATILADVVYSHPSWENAVWDSEDKRLVPFEDVGGKTEIEFDADFSLSLMVDDSGLPCEIDRFDFRNGNFLGVDLYPQDY